MGQFRELCVFLRGLRVKIDFNAETAEFFAEYAEPFFTLRFQTSFYVICGNAVMRSVINGFTVSDNESLR